MEKNTPAGQPVGLASVEIPAVHRIHHDKTQDGSPMMNVFRETQDGRLDKVALIVIADPRVRVDVVGDSLVRALDRELHTRRAG